MTAPPLIRLAHRVLIRTLDVAGLAHLGVPGPEELADVPRRPWDAPAGRWSLQGDRTVLLVTPTGARRAATVTFDSPRPTRAVVVVMPPELAASSGEAQELRSRIVADAELGPALVEDVLGEEAAP